MPNANYLRGRRFEWRVRDQLRKMGWTVLRTAGSKGPVDLVAVKAGSPVAFVQCKTRPPTDREGRAAQAFADLVGMMGEVYLAWPGKARGTVEWFVLVPRGGA